MGFFIFLLLVILICWIALLQGKVDSLSNTLKYVCKKINDYEKVAFTTKSQESVKKSEINETKDEPQTQVFVPEEKVVVQPQIKEQEFEKSEVQATVSNKILKEDFDLQKALLGNVFNKIGALAIIIAVIILIKLVSPFIVITPTMKFIFGVLLATGFIGCGFLFHKKDNLKNYSEVLLGTGFATSFITTFCGYSVLNIYNSTTAMILGGALLLSTYFVADRMKTVSMLVIGLIGGYLTPLCAEAKSEQLFGFLIFLNAVSAIYTLRCNKFNLINPINIFITMIYLLVIYLIKPEPNFVFPIVLWGIYIVYDLLRDKSSFVDNISSWINYAVLTFFSMIMFHNAHQTLGMLFVATAACYVLLAGGSRFSKNELFKTYEYFVLLNVWLYIAFILNDVQSVISWSIVALILSILACAYRLNYLTSAICWFYLTAFIGALLAQVDNQVCMFANYTPIINLRTLIFITPVLSMLISAKLLKTVSKKVSNWVKFLGLSLGYLYLIGEINSCLMRVSESGDFVDFNRFMIFIIIGYVYSLNAKKIANVTNSLLFNFASYLIFSLVTFVLLCCSYWYPDAYLPVINLRFAAYLLAIVACVMFSRWDKMDLFKYFAVFLGFLLCHSESAGISKLYGEGWQYLISLSWVLYSGIVTICGILKNRKYLLNSGIVIIVLTIARIFIFDLAKVDALYKLVAFLALGIILMLVSYIYTVNKCKK